MMSANSTTPGPRLVASARSVWRSAHRPVVGVPRWARTAAYLVPLVVLPSSMWRIVVVVFVAPPWVNDPSDRDDLPAWLPIELYVVLLSLVSELLAFTAVGLVAGWGERFPRWLPGLAGRRVPPPLAIVPAALGALVLTAGTLWIAVMTAQGKTIRGESLPDDIPLQPGTFEGVAFIAAYAPLLLWGPLLGAVTIAYWRRRNVRATG